MLSCVPVPVAEATGVAKHYDHHLLERIDETMVMLQSGCVCCTIRGELSTAIKDLHSRRERGLLPVSFGPGSASG